MRTSTTQRASRQFKESLSKPLQNSDAGNSDLGDGHLGNGGTVFDRGSLVNSRGVRYRDFKRDLRPRYGVVWTHLLCGHLTLLLVGAGVITCEVYIPTPFAVIAGVVGSLLLGYTFAYINLFFHEATHYLLASGRVRNDRLANLFIGVLFGRDIKSYRAIHFMHHRHLGSTQDPERTYFEPLNLRFFVELLTGIKALKVLRGWNRSLADNPRETNPSATFRSFLTSPLFLGLGLHFSIVAGAVWYGFWIIAVAWVLGMGLMYPMFGTVRQVLEHRGEHACDEIDYRQTPHGAVTRLFSDGLVASTFGAAGFNRHLLHHWEPQVSYTRLKDLENFLLDTEIGDHLRACRTSYLRAFLQLFRF